MPRPAELRHVAVEVAELTRSRWFYDRFLGRLGYTRFVSEVDYAGYRGGDLTVWVIKGTPARVRRHPPTGEEEVVPDHLAFWVPSARDVEAVQNDLAKQEIYPLFRCAERPEFRPGYFSAAWADPDQVVLEVYTVPPPGGRRSGSRRGAKPHRPPRRPARGRRSR